MEYNETEQNFSIERIYKNDLKEGDKDEDDSVVIDPKSILENQTAKLRLRIYKVQDTEGKHYCEAEKVGGNFFAFRKLFDDLQDQLAEIGV